MTRVEPTIAEKICALAVLACLLAMPADAQDTITIGGMHINGANVSGTPVTIEPSDLPGVLAVVTMDNRSVNEARDNGIYPLVLGDLTISVEFFYNIGPAQGADRITVLVPEGITCTPEDCSVTLIEGFTGSVTLHDWQGM